jgi:hypothetical protein
MDDFELLGSRTLAELYYERSSYSVVLVIILEAFLDLSLIWVAIET